MIGMVRSETSFVQSSWAWEIGSHPTGGAGRMKLSCVEPASVTHLTHSYILRKDPPPQCDHCQCILTVRHILVECNNFAAKRMDVFGKRNVMESFRFHPTLILLLFKSVSVL